MKPPRAVKTHGHRTMTKSAFFGMIRSVLRRRTMYWPPIREILEQAKRKSHSTNKRLKWEYQCSECKAWFPRKSKHVDHIVEAGSLTDYTDLPGFVERLFCEIDNLRVVCIKKCHNKKTYKR